MMASQHGPGQIVKIAQADSTAVLLPRRLGRIMSLLRNQRRRAVGAKNTLWPTQLTECAVALGVVQQVLKVDHRRETVGQLG
jgi:hypothetical protein